MRACMCLYMSVDDQNMHLMGVRMGTYAFAATPEDGDIGDPDQS